MYIRDVNDLISFPFLALNIEESWSKTQLKGN